MSTLMWYNLSVSLSLSIYIYIYERTDLSLTPGCNIVKKPCESINANKMPSYVIQKSRVNCRLLGLQLGNLMRVRNCLRCFQKSVSKWIGTLPQLSFKSGRGIVCIIQADWTYASVDRHHCREHASHELTACWKHSYKLLVCISDAFWIDMFVPGYALLCLSALSPGIGWARCLTNA